MAILFGRKEIENKIAVTVNEQMDVQRAEIKALIQPIVQECVSVVISQYMTEIKSLLIAQEGTLMTIYEDVSKVGRQVKSARIDIRGRKQKQELPVKKSQNFIAYLNGQLNKGQVHAALKFVYDELVDLGHPIYKHYERLVVERGSRPHGKKGAMPRMYDVVQILGLNELALSLAENAVAQIKEGR